MRHEKPTRVPDEVLARFRKVTFRRTLLGDAAVSAAGDSEPAGD